MLKKNDIIPLAITGLSHEGDGVGRFEGMAMFVPMTASDDEIEAKVVKVLKNRAYGIIHSIKKPSAFRVENDCPVYHRCGGCSLRHISYSHELDIKTDWVCGNLRRIAGIEIEPGVVLPSPASSRYRNKAQYPVRRVNGKITAGFFARRSHDLIPVEDCLLQPEAFAGIVREVVLFMEDFGVEPYDENAHEGVVRHIFIRLAEATGEIMLCLIINASALPREKAFVQRLGGFQGVASIAVNENREKTNVIFGQSTRVIYGPGFIVDELCGLRINISAQSFYQVNRRAAEGLYRAALELAAPEKDATLLDLYCGTGTIGLSMAHTVRRVIGVETVQQAVSDAALNAAQNDIHNAEFICADASDAARRFRQEGITPDIVILDPPRKGADEALLNCVDQLSPGKIIYISCDSATLARDIRRLADLGWVLEKVTVADLFPRTAHVEAVALLEKSKECVEVYQK